MIYYKDNNKYTYDIVLNSVIPGCAIVEPSTIVVIRISFTLQKNIISLHINKCFGFRIQFITYSRSICCDVSQLKL